MRTEEQDERLKALLERVRQARAALPEPSLETLRAYADGRLDPGLVQELELVLLLRPDLREEVELMRKGDERLEAAFLRGMQQGIEAPPSLLQRIWADLKDVLGSWMKPAPVLGLVAAAVLLLVFLPSPREALLPGQVSVLKLELGTEVRGSAEGVAIIHEGTPILVEHAVPEPYQQLVIAEVFARSVTLLKVAQRPLLPTEQVKLLAGAAPGERFLVRMLLQHPQTRVQLEEALKSAAARGPLLSTLPEDARSRAILQALGPEAGALVSSSALYRTEAP